MGVLLYSGMVGVRDSFHDRATFMSRATFLPLVVFPLESMPTLGLGGFEDKHTRSVALFQETIDFIE